MGELEVSGKLPLLDMNGLPFEPELEGPPEEIGTGLYRMVDGSVGGYEPEDLRNY